MNTSTSAEGLRRLVVQIERDREGRVRGAYVTVNDEEYMVAACGGCSYEITGLTNEIVRGGEVGGCRELTPEAICAAMRRYGLLA